MKHLAAALACSLLFTPSAASAADAPSKSTAPALKAVQTPSSWTGFYAGVNAGYGSSTIKDNVNELVAPPLGAFTFKRKLDGPSVGAQVGFNLQHETFVGGVEADFQKSWQRDQIQFRLFGDPSFLDIDAPWFATARLRAGVVTGPSFAYVTGGILLTERKPILFEGESDTLFHFSKKNYRIGARRRLRVDALAQLDLEDRISLCAGQGCESGQR
jgi:opacity protein-like surface antigen